MAPNAIAEASAPAYDEAVAQLEQLGFPSEAYELLFAWNETAPVTGDAVTGYRLRSAGDGEPFDVYCLRGDLLTSSRLGALGVPPKNWDDAVEQPAARGIPDTKATLLPPSPRSVVYATAPTGTIELPPLDMGKVRREDAQRDAKGPMRIGVFRLLPEQIEVHDGVASHGAWLPLPDGGHLWSVEIMSMGAIGQRMELAELALPAGGEVVAFDSAHPPEALGPFSQAPLWTPTCFGEAVVIECYLPAGTPIEDVGLRIPRIAHIYKSAFAAAIEKQAGACNLDVSCYPSWADTALGVGGLGTIGLDGVLWCTCSLLAGTDTCTRVPFVLTANHCVRDQAEASTLEFYWRYQRTGCAGWAPDPEDVPRTTGGADYLAGASGTGYEGGGNDFTLLRMRNAPPTDLTQLGWSTTVPALGTEITCVHHPRRDYKRISFGTLTDNENDHPSLYHQVTWHDGTTEPGSSGSPLMLAATQQIVGQLWGGSASCLLPDDPDYFGRFDVTYPVVAALLAAPAAIGFAQSALILDESDNAATVTVILGAPAVAPDVYVDYAVTGGTAQAEQDYTAVGGTLVFAVGETSRTFQIPILDNVRPEDTETVVLELSNPGCAPLDPQAATLVITIEDDDPDTDSDGLSDYEEINGVYGPATHPNLADTDGDGLSDYEEVIGSAGYVTNPLLTDTDDDGVDDFAETLNGSNPLDPSDTVPLSSMALPFFSSAP